MAPPSTSGGGSGPAPAGPDPKAALAASVRARMDTQAQDAFMREFESMVVCPLWCVRGARSICGAVLCAPV